MTTNTDENTVITCNIGCFTLMAALVLSCILAALVLALVLQ